jgi:TetR/AcrR family transcriptional regulator, transcriptional repressor for nem operon
MRYKEFNSNVVLEKCITLFWERGFTSCPISEIVNRTRVNRSSLYDEFESKEGILVEGLNLYHTRYGLPKIEILEGEGSMNQVAFDFYWSYMQSTMDRPFGCFMIHIATELADSNESVKAILDQYLEAIKNGFIGAMKKRNFEESEHEFLAGQFIGLFCTAMSFCLIHTEEQRKNYIEKCLKVILFNKKENVTSTS